MSMELDDAVAEWDAAFATPQDVDEDDGSQREPYAYVDNQREELEELVDAWEALDGEQEERGATRVLLGEMGGEAEERVVSFVRRELPGWRGPSEAERKRKEREEMAESMRSQGRKRRNHARERLERRANASVSWALPEGASVSLTGVNGERVYIKKRDMASEEAERRTREAGAERGVLLGRPFGQVLQEAYDCAVARRLQREEGSSREGMGEEDEMEGRDEEAQVQTQNLWVHKYAARSYVELLSNEEANRTVLGWVKAWDEVVFRGAKEGGPEEKLLLLAGPPGYGKTTLAHVVAEHAGYKALELNASDERTASKLVERVENASSTNTLLGSEKPALLILDEIDGAMGGSEGRGAVNALVAYVEKKGLRRPVVCICNELYSASLRPLRAVAKVVEMKKPRKESVMGRLQQVCREEELEADVGALAKLVELSDNDIRACVNALQFVSRRSGRFTRGMITPELMGQKDVKLGYFAVLQKIYQRKRRGGDGRELARMLERTSEQERLAQGVFESMPTARPGDPEMVRSDKALEWLGFYDMMQAGAVREQAYTLMRYQNVALEGVHVVQGKEGYTRVSWPFAYAEAEKTRRRVREEVHRVWRGVDARVCAYVSQRVLVQEIVGSLVDVLSPKMREVSVHLLTNEEKDRLSELAWLLVEYGLRMSSQSDEEGKLKVQFTPDVAGLLPMEGRARARGQLSAAGVQEVARELRRVASTRENGQVSGAMAMDALREQKEREEKAREAGNSQVAETVVRRDFFGRVIKEEGKRRDGAGGGGESGEGGGGVDGDGKAVRYHFQSGFTNAVKRWIVVGYLL